MNNYQLIKYKKTNTNLGNILKKSNSKALGEILQEADLVSSAQIEVVLRDQTIYQDMRIGEILALRGWLKPETADFFVEKWPSLLRQKDKQPLGFYLQEAALLEPGQIKEILNLQRQEEHWVRFGKMAVIHGLLSQKTVDFFLENLASKYESETLFISRKVMNDIRRTTSY
jgi:hypothetical protein